MANTYVQVGTYSSWNLNASGDVVELEFTAGASDIGLILGGTFVATVQFEIGLIDAATGITWTSLTCNPVPSGDGATSATAPGTWSAVVAGFTHFRFRCSAYTSGRIYATVNAVLAANEAISGNPTAGQLAAFSNGAQISGVPNSSVDPSTGDVTLGAGLFVTEYRRNPYKDSSVDPGVTIWNSQTSGDAGVTIRDDGASIAIVETGPNGISIENLGAGVLDLHSEDGGITIDTTAGAGPISLASAGTMTFDDTALSGGGSKLDLDATTPGVATLSTIFNAVGGYQANGTPGISGSGTTMSSVTVVNGIITAATSHSTRIGCEYS